MRTTHIVAMLLTVVSVGACAPPPPATTTAPSSQAADASRPSAPKRITAVVRGDPRTLSEPVNAAAGGSTSAGVRELEQLVSAGLGYINNRNELLPQLAETMPTLENGLWRVSPDGRMDTTWKLKPNLVWQDGTPLTVDDLMFTAMVGQDKSLTMTQDQAFQFIDGYDTPDDQTLHVSWKTTFVDADKLFTQAVNMRNLPLPKHLLEPAYREDKVNFTSSPYLGPEYVGSGPYKLKEWVLGSHMVLEANDRFVLGRPKIDQIEVRFILDTNTMVANLLAGSVQLSLGRGLTPEQAISVRDQWKEGIVDAGLQNTTSLYPQLLDPTPAILTDARFRRALLMGLDRQQMVDTFLAGLVPVAYSLISPDEPEFKSVDSAIVKYPFDPRKSMEVLDGMGLTKGSDGFYRDANGQRLSVEVRTRTHVLREKIQQVIADEWARIGIVGEPSVTPEQRVSDRAYQATFPGFYFRFGDPSQIVDMRSNDVAVAENNYVGRNTQRYQNPQYDAIINRYVTTIPQAERLSLLQQIVNFSTDQALLLPLYHEPEPVLISNKLVNVGGRRGLSVQAWNAFEWDIKS